MRSWVVDKFSDGPFLKKIDFLKFDQCGMGSGMFRWSKRLRLLNLSLIYEIMKICKKKLSTLSTGNLPVATTLSQIGQNKQ